MEHAKRKTQQYTKYTQYINENVLNEKRNSSINIKCSKFVLFIYYFFIGFYLLYFSTSPIVFFRFDFLERMNRTRKQRLDSISALQSVDRQIDKYVQFD